MVPAPTVTVTVVAVVAVIAAAVPPIVTAVAPVKLVPLITKEVPTHPLDAPKLVIVGGVGGVQVNVLPELGKETSLVLQVALFVRPAVVELSQTALPEKLLLLKSVLDDPLRPTCTFMA